MNRAIYTFFIFFISILFLNGQAPDNERYVQVSGIITDEAERLVAGAAITSKKLKRGTVSEQSGIYSITSIPGDTIFFRALGYKRYHTIIPVGYSDKHCTVDIRLDFDTLQIAGVNILPWRTYNEFLKDITRDKPVDPIIENMNENLASIYVAITNQTGVRISSEAGYRYAMEQNFSNMITKNQYPINNLLNPMAWGKFINGVKNGMFKNQKFNRPEEAKVRKKIKKPKKK